LNERLKILYKENDKLFEVEILIILVSIKISLLFDFESGAKYWRIRKGIH